MSHTATNTTLIEAKTEAVAPDQSVIGQVASDHGIHPLRQIKEIVTLRLGRGKLGSDEYYDMRVFDPAHDKRAKKQFMGQGGINAMNAQMNPDRLMETKSFVANKLVYPAHLAKAGIATTDVQAFVTTQIQSDKDYVLADAGALERFLREEAVYPIFGKPLGGSLSEGSARIEAREGDVLRLGNGNAVPLGNFVADVLRCYPDGYLLQTALSCHAEMVAVAGPAVGCVRVVTAHDGTGVAPVYATWKLPAKGAMSDNSWQDGTLLAQIDLATGAITACNAGKGPQAELIDNHPVSGKQLVGMVMPHWSRTVAAAVAAHEQTPDLGICGFDVAITDDGPVILECNDNPNHKIYQYPAREGVRNPRLAPIWDAVIARQKKAG